MFRNPAEHLKAELARLDLLLHRQVLRLSASYQLSLDEFRGLYISDERVDSLLSQAEARHGTMPDMAELATRAEAIRQANAAQVGDDPPWGQVAREFGLSPFEQDVLLLALAPEVDLKYETIYAYLNNDVSRKWPTCDLALRLFATDPSQQTSLRRYLLPEATLFSSGLLQPVQPSPDRPSWLAVGFCLAPSVSHTLLGFPAQEPSLLSCVTQINPRAAWDELPLSAELRVSLNQLSNLFKHSSPDKPAPMLVFEGDYGSGSDLAAEALCRDLSIPLLQFDMTAARATPEPLPRIMQALTLQLRLHQAGIYVQGSEVLFDNESNPSPEAHTVFMQLAQLKGPVFFTCAPGTRWRELARGQRCLVFRFGDLDFRQRLRLWEKCVLQQDKRVSLATLEALADRFVLAPGQIKDAVSTAIDSSDLRGHVTKELSSESLFEAARTQSDQNLGNLAPKVVAMHTWDDLVLPLATLRQLKQVAAAIRYSRVVYSDWGFEHRIPTGKGLKVLFSGASGTGKTIAAGVIARDLGVDLYKIDLSGIVSKYIGETEKNLDRIFRAAHSSNAILFFDEADALFGKRSEVKDAHDRYANIEVAYLLQKMEEHEGAVILASNLSRNIDQSFSRRMHYVVEFPLPDDAHRERLWRGMFPPQVPLGEDVDLRFLARQFPMAGGDIKNVALDAAFLAAQDGRVVGMRHLVQATARQMMKQGKIPSPTEFKQYHSLIAQVE